MSFEYANRRFPGNSPERWIVCDGCFARMPRNPGRAAGWLYHIDRTVPPLVDGRTDYCPRCQVRDPAGRAVAAQYLRDCMNLYEGPVMPPC